MSAAAGICVVFAFVAIGVLVFRGLTASSAEDRAWRAFAAQHGLTLTGQHPFVALEGTWGGHAIALNVHHSHHHRGASSYSQHFTLTLVPSIHDLFVGPAEILEQRGAALHGEHFTTGDAAFDARFRMKASDVAAARAWLDARRRAVLLASPPAVHVDYHGLRVLAPHVPVPAQVARQLDELAAMANQLR